VTRCVKIACWEESGKPNLGDKQSRFIYVSFGFSPKDVVKYLWESRCSRQRALVGTIYHVLNYLKHCWLDKRILVTQVLAGEVVQSLLFLFFDKRNFSLDWSLYWVWSHQIANFIIGHRWIM